MELSRTNNLRHKNLQIEGLRGIACLMVMLFHITYRYCDIYQPDYQIPKEIAFAKEFGTYGVLMFFIISFFFMGDSKKSENVVVQFLKKYYTLLIPYIVSITITFLCEHFMDLPGRAVGIKTYLVNLTMLQGLLGFDDVDGAHWYLYTLLVLSAWIILIENVFKNNKIYVYAIFLLMVENADILQLPERIFQPRFASVAVFIIMVKYYIGINSTIKDKIPTIVIGLIALVATGARHGASYSVLLVLFSVVFVLCYKEKIKILEIKPLVYLGALSYYIYLIHQNMSFMIMNTMVTALGKYRLWYSLICVPLVFLLAIFIKTVSQVLFHLLNNFKGDN